MDELPVPAVAGAVLNSPLSARRRRRANASLAGARTPGRCGRRVRPCCSRSGHRCACLGAVGHDRPFDLRPSLRNRAPLAYPTNLVLANTGLLDRAAASPAFVLVQAFAAHRVRVAPYVRQQQPAAAAPASNRGCLHENAVAPDRSAVSLLHLAEQARAEVVGALSQLDDEGQRRREPPDPRNAKVRQLAGSCRPTLSPAALPVAEQSSHAAAVTGVGVERSRTTPATPRRGPGVAQTVRERSRATVASESTSCLLRSTSSNVIDAEQAMATVARQSARCGRSHNACWANAQVRKGCR